MFRRRREKEDGKAEAKEPVPKSGSLSQELVDRTGTLPVVGSQFCKLNTTLVFTVQKKRTQRCSGGDLLINDADAIPLARADARDCLFQDKRTLRNASGKTILTLKRKVFSFKHEWHAYRGEKTDPAKLLFRAKTPWPLQYKTVLKVYMAFNTDEEQWNFIVKGDYKERESFFYYGARSIAQLSRKTTPSKEMLPRDTFLINVQPGVDYMFIIALVVILDEINKDHSTD